MSPRSAAARVVPPRTTAARTTAARTSADRATPRPSAARTATTAKSASTVKSSLTATSAAVPKATTPRRTATPTTGSRPDLRVVPSVPVRRVSARPARSERGAPFALLVAALLVGTALALLVLHIATGVDSIEATDLRQANASAAQEVQSLERQVVANGTPAALAVAATAAGLVPAGSAAYLVIAPDGSSTVRGSVHPAPEPVKPSRVPADRD